METKSVAPGYVSPSRAVPQANVVLAEMKAGANVSGYVYLYLPKRLCQAFDVGKGTVFIATYQNGRLAIRKKE